ncbi:MAG: hypothetical protein NZ839_04490, partial [Endomicrobia bacterium]|nr:hypothetical protein [Endomicrobiia bacterium]
NSIFFEMTEVGYKVYKFEYYHELTTLIGKNIVYQYFIDNNFPDPQGKRTVVIQDFDNDGVMEVYDTWGVPKVEEYYIPDCFAYFAVEKSTGVNNKVIIQLDPEKITKISSITVYSANNEFITQIYPDEWQEIIYTTYTNCYLVVSFTEGKKEKTSILTLGESIPKKKFIDKFIDTTIGYHPDVHKQGRVVVKFKVPEKLQNESLQPTSFVIRYTTSVLIGPITSYYFDLPVVKKIKAHQPTADEIVNLNFYSNGSFPSVFLIIGCIYGNNEMVGLIKPMLVVLPEVAYVQQPFVATKGNYTVGFTTGECKASIIIEKFSIKEKVDKYAVVVKNYYELLLEETINSKIKLANTKLQDEYRFKLIEFNKVQLNNYDKRNTIFGFYLYLYNNEDYFVDQNNDGIPDRNLTKDAVIEIPYPDELNEDKLIICKLNSQANFWQPVDKQNFEVDKTKKVVRFKTRTFSVYMVAEEGSWAKDLSKVEVYPNPFIASDSDKTNGEFNSGDAEYECLNFVHLTENSKIYIFNLAMELVYKEENVKNKSPVVGKYRWNFKDENHKTIPSGMYFYLIKDETLPEKNYAKGRFTFVR